MKDRKVILPLLALLGFQSLFLYSCGNADRVPLSHDSNNPQEYSKTLIVYPDAKEIHYTKHEDLQENVIYEVFIGYPASKLIAYISNNLENMEYQPLEESYLNPGQPSSHVRGWGEFIDATKKPKHKVKQWVAQWKNEDGDVVWCGLKYENPVNDKENFSDLSVFIGYSPNSVARAILKEVITKENR